MFMLMCFGHLNTQHKIMDVSLTYRIDIHLATIYFNNGTPNMFRINVDVTLSDMKQQLDQINRSCNNCSNYLKSIMVNSKSSIFSF
jgi:hypothetical protein